MVTILFTIMGFDIQKLLHLHHHQSIQTLHHCPVAFLVDLLSYLLHLTAWSYLGLFCFGMVWCGFI